MPIFKPIVPNYTYAKIALHGWKGSGKSFTSVLVALCICKAFNIKMSNIAYLDTEGRAIDIQESLGEPLGFRLNHSTTRSFDSLMGAITECEQSGYILIADSITHFWRSFVKGYLASKNRKVLQIQDHAIIQDKWQTFVDRFMNSKVHIITAGRSANVFEDVMESEDDDSDDNTPAKKKYKMRVTGTKMAVEKEFGYEPGLVFEIQKKFSDHSSSFAREIIVSKDSTSLLEGKVFNCESIPMSSNPSADEMKATAAQYVKNVWAIFGTYLTRIAKRSSVEGAAHQAYDTYDAGSFWQSKEVYAPDKRTLCEIKLELIEAAFHQIFGEARGAAKSLRFFTLEKIFKTPSWTEITKLPLTELEFGAQAATALRDIFKARPNDEIELTESLLGEMIEKAFEISINGAHTDNAFDKMVTDSVKSVRDSVTAVSSTQESPTAKHKTADDDKKTKSPLKNGKPESTAVTSEPEVPQSSEPSTFEPYPPSWDKERHEIPSGASLAWKDHTPKMLRDKAAVAATQDRARWELRWRLINVFDAKIPSDDKLYDALCEARDKGIKANKK